ncbi:MAG: murein biosynthesis integral membrane protein MurJ, partial [Micromonosporaceae bacterium]
MTEYRGRRRAPDDPEESWIDQGPLAYEEPEQLGGGEQPPGQQPYQPEQPYRPEQTYQPEQAYEPPRRYSTEDHHYRRDDYPADREYQGDEPTRQQPAVPPAGPPPYQPQAPQPPPYQPPPPPRHQPPPGQPPPGQPPPGQPPPRRPPPTDADATIVMPKLRNAPQAPPTPVPQLQLNPADTTMLMSAVPYFAPSATPAYTGTIYVSYAASRAQMEDEAATRPEAERAGAAASVARSGAIMALGSIVSRLTGFLRVAVLGAAIGVTIGNTYSTANTVPSMVYELLLGGILTSVLVPLLVRARESDPDKGQAFTQRLLTLAVLTLGAATILAVLSAPLLTWVLAGDRGTETDRQLMTTLAYLLLPEVFFFGIAGILAAVLNTRGHFAAPMWTPILNNVVVIGAAVVFIVVSPRGELSSEAMTGAQIGALGIGTTLGIAVQAFGLVPALRKVGFRWRWRFDFAKLRLGELGRIAGWMLCYVAVSQIAVVVIMKLAYAAGTQPGAAGPWIYNNAFLLFMMAHGIVGVSIITALMPRMSAAAANHRYREVARNISLGTRLTSVVLVPVMAAYVVLGTSITVVLFTWGRYTVADAKAAALVVAVAGVGLIPFAISQLQTFAFYALTETKTAALVNIPVVATKVLVDVGVYYTLPAKYVAAGLMFGNLLGYAAGAYLSARLLRARLGPMGQGEVFRTLARLMVAGVVAAFACAAVVWILNLVLGDGKGSHLVRLIIGGGVLVLVYLGAAWAMRVREISDVLELVDRKLGGRLPLPKRRGTPPSDSGPSSPSTGPLAQPGPAPRGRRPQPGGPTPSPDYPEPRRTPP